MKKMINSERIEGRVYQHNLQMQTVKNKESKNYGKPFISGNLEIATDEDCINVIPVHFTYVTEITSSGNKNATYDVLNRIINGEKTVVANGKEEALKVRVDTALALNDFYNQEEHLISSKVNEGGFVSIINELKPENERNTFTTDMLITKITKVDKDEEKHIDNDFVRINGYIFNFRNNILPMEFIVKNAAGMKYFEDLEVSNSEPIFTKVWGRINCSTIKTEVKEESAFGESAVKTFERKVREWIITGTSVNAYELGEEKVLTAEDVTKAIADREVMLAEVKKRSDDYRASKENANNAFNNDGNKTDPTSSSTVKKEAFNF